MKISGTIFDKSDLSPLPGASINIIDPSGKISSFGTTSDSNGKFLIDSNSIISNTTFRISYIGYKDQLYAAPELINKNIFLSPQAYELEGLTINKDNSSNLNNSIIDNIKKNKKSYALALGAVAIIGSVILIKKYI